MRDRQRTVHDHSGCGAAPFRHYVTGQAGVVARVGQTRLVDDEVVVGSGVDVVVSQGTQLLIVFQPFNLGGATKSTDVENVCSKANLICWERIKQSLFLLSTTTHKSFVACICNNYMPLLFYYTNNIFKLVINK